MVITDIDYDFNKELYATYSFVKVKTKFTKIKNNNKAYRSRRAILKMKKRREYGFKS